MAIKVKGTTVIDDSRDVLANNVKVTGSIYDSNSSVGISGYVRRNLLKSSKKPKRIALICIGDF